MNKVKNSIKKLFSNRIFVLFFVILLAFLLIAKRLFTLQIIKGEDYSKEISLDVLKEIQLKAPRGEIYDRYGRPLAENKVVFQLQIDSDNSMTSEQMNEILFELINLLRENEESVYDILPITKIEPYTFLFDGDLAREKSWKQNDLSLKGDESKKNASETMEYLKKLFDISEDFEEDMARDIISIRYAIYNKRFTQFDMPTIALDVSEKTVAEIKENSEKFNSIIVDVDSVRVYPEGKYFSHLLGYIRTMDEDEFEKKYETYGYNKSDLVGKIGLEKSLELELKGENGKAMVEVDVSGKIVNEFEDSIVAAKPGKKVFVSLDKDLQKKTYDLVENQLNEIILARLRGGSGKHSGVNLYGLLTSMIESNSISTSRILKSKEGSVQFRLKEHFETFNIKEESFETYDEYLKAIKEKFIEAVNANELNFADLIFIMEEQKLFTLNDIDRADLKSGNYNAFDILYKKIETLEIEPHETGLDPCTASVTVTNPNTGEVLAAVTYPSYDNNELSGNFNYDYYLRLLENTSTPLIYRSFAGPTAPGSTFKMVTALAGLEEGTIIPSTYFQDYYTFKDAGVPYANCNSHHASVNVIGALEASCNYFFYQTSYNMGNTKSGTKYVAIENMRKYAKMFGFLDYTGVEIEEESKPHMFSYDKDDPERDWRDGDTIRAAIGQADINVTTANIVKYVSTIASNGNRYKMFLVSKMENADGQLEITEPVLEYKLEVKDSNLKILQEGMKLVTSGARGTARGVFSDFEIETAGKTGTIQHGDKTRVDHTSFTAYAPFDNPQIAIATSIPYGNGPMQAAARITKEIIAAYMGMEDAGDKSYLDSYILP